MELAGALATSGTYERGNHLIDPYSGRPAARAASASVTGPDLGLADALATAVAVAGEPRLALIGTLDGYEVLIINVDGSKRCTKRFPIAADRAARLNGAKRSWRAAALQVCFMQAGQDGITHLLRVSGWVAGVVAAPAVSIAA